MKSNRQNYISLQDATRYCGYSQEYLSLRARQGKLKSVKVGRNWMTKKEWLDGYLKKVKEYNFVFNKKTNTKTSASKKRKKRIKVQVVKTVEPPENLPVERIEAQRIPTVYSPHSRISAPFVLTLSLIILVSGLILAKDDLKNIYGAFFNQTNQEIVSEMISVENTKYILRTFGEYGLWLEENIEIGAGNTASALRFLSEVMLARIGLHDLDSPQAYQAAEFKKDLTRALSSLGFFIDNNVVGVKTLFSGRIITKEIQMLDRATNKNYCVWIQQGEWQKVEGKCGDLDNIK